MKIPTDVFQVRAFGLDPLLEAAVSAATFSLSTMFSLMGKIETWTPETNSDVMHCLHCGWHAIIVRSEFYEAARAVRISYERHPDRRTTEGTECPVRGAYWIKLSRIFRLIPTDAPSDHVKSALEGYALGSLFRLIEVESRYPQKPSEYELAEREMCR